MKKHILVLVVGCLCSLSSWATNAADLPFAPNFGVKGDTTEEYKAWTVVDVNDDTCSWMLFTPSNTVNELYYGVGSLDKKKRAIDDEQLYSRPVSLQEGKEYVLELTHFIGNNPWGAYSFAVEVGLYTKTENFVRETELFRDTLTSTAEGKKSVRFAPATTAEYYIGFKVKNETPSTFRYFFKNFLLYEMKDIDLMMGEIILPAKSVSHLDSLPLSIKLLNKGKNAVSNFSLGIQINNGEIKLFQHNKTVQPGQEMLVMVDGMLEFPLDTNLLKVFVTAENAANLYNDTLTVQVSEYPGDTLTRGFLRLDFSNDPVKGRTAIYDVNRDRNTWFKGRYTGNENPANDFYVSSGVRLQKDTVYTLSISIYSANRTNPVNFDIRMGETVHPYLMTEEIAQYHNLLAMQGGRVQAPIITFVPKKDAVYNIAVGVVGSTNDAVMAENVSVRKVAAVDKLVDLGVEASKDALIKDGDKKEFLQKTDLKVNLKNYSTKKAVFATPVTCMVNETVYSLSVLEKIDTSKTLELVFKDLDLTRPGKYSIKVFASQNVDIDRTNDTLKLEVENTIPTHYFAPIGSYWKYWMATANTYGFHEYRVEKDSLITAPLADSAGVSRTWFASWFVKYTHQTMHGQMSGNTAKVSEFAMARIGNVAYVWESKTKKWFKYIDMEAKPGDKWLVPEISRGKGVYDYVEVSLLDTMDFGGLKDVPMIRLMPSCSSRFTTAQDFTSRLSMAGYYNIDYIGPYTFPEAIPNGFVYTNNFQEVAAGLLCAKVGDTYIETEKLAEYVEFNNKPFFDRGIIDCDSLTAPVRPDAPEKNTMTGGFVFDTTEFYAHSEFEGFAAQTPKNNAAPTVEVTLPDTIVMPVVVHIVYNPNTPEEKIDEKQVQSLLDELNLAYSTKKTNQVREVFQDVIGNPRIRFALARKDENGEDCSGIVYHETDKDYFAMKGNDIKERYAFKFNADGTPRNWNNQKYTNIFVVDLGGFDQKANIGGFVTNPEYKTSEEFEAYKEWIKYQNTAYWRDWVVSEEGKALDGLTVDTWYTFGGKSSLNPKATFATAIHELGHYFGLRHPNIVILENADKSLDIVDDGFDDTPYTHYTQYALVPCGEEIRQCGNLVQVENYMDYALECAAMFTKQQAGFMRKFLTEVRPEFFMANSDTVSNEVPGRQQLEIEIYPNPVSDKLWVKGSFSRVDIYDISSKKVMSFTYSQVLDLGRLPNGMYLLRFYDTHNHTAVKKVIKNRKEASRL